MPEPVLDPGILSDDDVYWFNEGTHYRLASKLGAHPIELNGVKGTAFAVWAPDAGSVSVIGDFNEWNREAHPLQTRQKSGIWHGFIPGVSKGAIYKYYVVSRHHGSPTLVVRISNCPRSRMYAAARYS